MQHSDEAARYLKSCRSEFWQKVFEAELGYLLQHLKKEDRILSVGCGPAVIESNLAGRGFNLVGLDVSPEAIKTAPDSLRTVTGRAEEMPFPDASFDQLIYIVSLQFIEDYQQAIAKTTSVLKPDGKLLVMMLNPHSEFFKTKYADTTSYVRKLRHKELLAIENCIAEQFEIHTEYFMGVKGDDLFDSTDPSTAALYIIRGIKKNLHSTNLLRVLKTTELQYK